MRWAGMVSALVLAVIGVAAGLALLITKAHGPTDAPRGAIVFVGCFLVVCGACFAWVAMALLPRDK